MFLDQYEKEKSTKHFAKAPQRQNHNCLNNNFRYIYTVGIINFFEIRPERNVAYRSSLSIGNTEIAFAWDNEKILINIDEMPANIEKFIEKNTTINRAPIIDIFNIGVGTVKTVEFECNNKENINQFVHALKKHCDTYIELDKNVFLVIEKDTQ